MTCFATFGSFQMKWGGSVCSNIFWVAGDWFNPHFYLELVRFEFRQKFYIDLFIYSALTRRNHLCLHGAYNSVGGTIIKKTFWV